VQDDTTSRIIRFASELIRLPSVLGNEGAVACRVVDEMRRLGFDLVETDPVGNVQGAVDSGKPGPTLLIDAHMDTVGVLPESAWTLSPFSGAVTSGRLYGRGAADMKGALAAAVYGIASLDRRSFSGRVVVSASVGEETAEGAALETVVERWKPDFVVIGEATGLNLAVGGRGRAELTVEVVGVPAHASTPHLGVHAVEGMFRLADEVGRLTMREDSLLGRGVVCLTDIISEPYPAQSTVPALCRATFERRLMDGESRETVLADFKACADRSGCRQTGITFAEAGFDTYTGHRLAGEKWYPAWKMPADHPLVVSALQALHAAGIPASRSAYQFCTNAALTAGRLGIPTVGFGPGVETRAHVVDEFVEVAELESAFRGYHAIAAALLSSSSVPLERDGK